MYVLTVKNVHKALPEGLKLLRTHGSARSSRNGEVIVANKPVTTAYLKPLERVLFWPERNANPFFHFFESLWMLAGRNDVATVSRFVKRMETFSDDGVIFHAAYGHRWRKHFDMEGGGSPTLPDQLPIIIDRLKKDPTDRRSVLVMWDPVADLDAKSKDLPCNTHAYFTRDYRGNLDMTVCCRSNDIIWGAYGANAVHYSVLQEYIAAGIGCPVGQMWQVSNNYHAYKEVYDTLKGMADYSAYYYIRQKDPYELKEAAPYPIVGDFASWDTELLEFFDKPTREHAEGSLNPFFQKVALPLWKAHTAYKEKDFETAYDWLGACLAIDWQKACVEWLLRIQEKLRRAHDDGVPHE